MALRGEGGRGVGGATRNFAGRGIYIYWGGVAQGILSIFEAFVMLKLIFHIY